MGSTKDAFTILLVDDEPNVSAAIKRSLEEYLWTVLTATSANQGLEILAEHDIDVVVSDEKMPEMSGSIFLTHVRKQYPQTIRIILTGQAELDTAIRAINGGEIYRYFTKPCNCEELAGAIRQGLQRKQLVEKSQEMLHGYQKNLTVLKELEKEDPGITRLETDEDGALYLETVALDLDELIKEIE